MRAMLIGMSLLLGTAAVEAEPITISGLSWAGDRDKQVSSLTQAGYDCKKDQFADIVTFSARDSIKCSKEKN